MIDSAGGAASQGVAGPGDDVAYAPQRRTALVLSGIGTAGAYHAGVLRALHEAGVKIDVVAGRGIGVGAAGGLVQAYLRAADAAFAPDMLPTWLPRLVLLVLGAAGAAALADGWLARGRKARGPIWWHAIRPVVSSGEAVHHCWRVM